MLAASRTICSISAPTVHAGERPARGRALAHRRPQVERLEREIDAMNASCGRSTRSSSRRHTGCGLSPSARTVTRRAERLVCALAAAEPVNPEAVKYLNRLSDHLFVLGRRVNDNGARDVLWRPGANR